MADSKLLNPSSSASPPPNCAICLGSCSNKCFSDTCMHQFCFNCLLQWSKIKAECPLCKQPFKSIIHNVKSNEEYEEHIVEDTRPIHIIDNEQYFYLPQSPPSTSRQHRFHFRTTFTVNTHGENAIQRMLLSHSLTNGISISPHNFRWSPPNVRRTRRNTSTTTTFRRSIYNSNLWACPSPDIGGRYREVSPEYFLANPASRTRVAPWLNRELNALLDENTQDVMQLVDTVMDYLLRYHICSRSFKNLLQPYLGLRTDHFVHEFYHFMRSPFDMIGYDRHVIYLERPTSPAPLIDISEDNNSDVQIVEENPVVIEVHSSESDDVIMLSHPAQIPKPQLLPASSESRRSRKRARRTELPSSSSSDEEQHKRNEERMKRRRKMHGDNKRWRLDDDSSDSDLDDLPLASYIKVKDLINKKLSSKKKGNLPSKRDKRFPPSKSRTASSTSNVSREEPLSPRRRSSCSSCSSSSSQSLVSSRTESSKVSTHHRKEEYVTNAASTSRVTPKDSKREPACRAVGSSNWPVLCETPSTSGLKTDHISEEQPLALTSHRRFTPVKTNPFTLTERQDTLPVFDNSTGWYNASHSGSPDLIDLSVSKMKTETTVGEAYSMNQSPDYERPNTFYPTTSPDHRHLHSLDYKPKVEPQMSDYNGESSSKYWTDFAAMQSSNFNSSNDSSAFNCYGQRKSVIQNSGYYNYCNKSPMWSSSNSPAVNYTQQWSDSD